MKKIGFVDYYLSEWHANNYPAWIRKANEALGEDFAVSYAWAEMDVSPVDGRTTEAWCEAFGVEKCATIEELCEKSDYILILAPTNPETHLRLSGKVLPYGKPTYIDKTFAPDVETAEKIFAMAEKYGTPFFSTSALRYASELQDLFPAHSVITTGGGSNLPEYIIHQIEMVVKLLKAESLEVRVEPVGKSAVVTVDFEDGKRAVMNYGEAYPFTVLSEKEDGTIAYRSMDSDYFYLLLKDILEFFRTGKAPFDSKETMTVMKIREEVIKKFL